MRCSRRQNASELLGSAFPGHMNHSMVIFRAGLQVQLEMLEHEWSADVLHLPACGREETRDGQLIWAGPRAKMGVYEASPTRVMPHVTSGRTDYFGPMVNRCSPVCACLGGERGAQEGKVGLSRAANISAKG